MTELEQLRCTLQESMNIMGALASGIEELLGRPANGMAYFAGKRLGQRFSAGIEPKTDLLAALEDVRRVLHDNHCLWAFEPFRFKSAPGLITVDEEGDEVLHLVFRDCMIRQSLFRFGHQQKGSLCNMMYGFFAGSLGAILGRQATLEILHAGENACFKRLVVRR
jgi:predicted hydrocarbon binding protein